MNEELEKVKADVRFAQSYLRAGANDIADKCLTSVLQEIDRILDSEAESDT